MSEQGHLRIGTADRTDAVARLRVAAAEGRLTTAEAQERIAGVDGDLRRQLRRELTTGRAPASGWVEEHQEMPNANDLR